MKKQLLLSTLSFVLNFSTLSFSTEDLTNETIDLETKLSISQGRTQDVSDAVKDTFKKISSLSMSGWHENGYVNASFGIVSGDNLLIWIMEKNSKQKFFRIMDLGSGEFQCVDDILESLINNKKFYGDSDKIISIYATRGESLEGEESSNFKHKSHRSENCPLYRLGKFPVENITAGLQNIDQYAMQNEFDVITTRYCLLHLVDPLGTLLEAFKHLRPGGFMIFDGFPIPFEDDKKDAYGCVYEPDAKTPTKRLLNFLNDLGIPALCNFKGELRGASYVEVLIQKPTENYTIPNLPWQYTGVTKFNFGHTQYNKAVYKRTVKSPETQLLPEGVIMGDENLYKTYKSIEKLSDFKPLRELKYGGPFIVNKNQ